MDCWLLRPLGIRTASLNESVRCSGSHQIFACYNGTLHIPRPERFVVYNKPKTARLNMGS
jgi:hypothetical protein